MMENGMGCRRVYENMLRENVVCGSIRHNEQGVGIRLCRECIEKRDALVSKNGGAE